MTIEKDVNDEKQKMISEKQNFVCKNCEPLSLQIVQLKRVLERYEKGQIGLEGVLSQQRYSNDKSGLGYSKFSKPSTSKVVFVKANDQPSKEKVNNLKFFITILKRKYFLKRNLMFLDIEATLNLLVFIAE